MSLINEALKKAQSEQHGRNAPSARTPSLAATPGAAGRSRRPFVLVLAVLLVLAGAGAFYLFQTPADAPLPPVTPRPKPVVKPVTPAPTAPAAPVVPVVPKTGTPAATPDAPVAIPEKPPVRVTKSNPAVAALVDVMRVTFARADTGRCVVDGVVRKVGDRVVEEPRLDVFKVTDSAVVFVDAAGYEYTKQVTR